MTDPKPPSAGAMEAAREFFGGCSVEEERLAETLDAFAERRAAEARRAAIAEGLAAIRFAHEWIGGLPVTPSFEDKRAAQATLEAAMASLRALADKPADGKGEPP